MLPEQQEFIEKLYRRLYPELMLYARRHLANPSLAEELVQDTFHEAVQKIENVMNHPYPERWLVVTLQNKMYNCKREIARQKEKLLSLDEEALASILVVDSAEKTALDTVSFRDTTQQIDQALTKEEKYILRRFAFEEASHREIADELGISLWASQKRLTRIRSKLDTLFPRRRKKK